MEKTVVLPVDTENKTEAGRSSDIVSIGAVLPETTKTADPLPLAVRAGPVDEVIKVLPVTCSE